MTAPLHCTAALHRRTALPHRTCGLYIYKAKKKKPKKSICGDAMGE
jgi:hypothetical protein